MVVSTYQAASGAGAAAMEELELQTREVFSLSTSASFQLFMQQINTFFLWYRYLIGRNQPVKSLSDRFVNQ